MFLYYMTILYYYYYYNITNIIIIYIKTVNAKLVQKVQNKCELCLDLDNNNNGYLKVLALSLYCTQIL